MSRRFLMTLAAVMAAMTMSATKLGLYVGGVQVNTDNANSSNKVYLTGSNIKAYDTSKPYSAVYDISSKTLTLTNVKIERTGSGNRAIQNDGVIYLTIVFDGANYLSAKDQGTIKIDEPTTIKSAGGRDDATTYIYGGSEDALCVFHSRTCTIDGANLYIEAANSDAIWADSQYERLEIKNSRVVAVSKKSGGHAIYNFLNVYFDKSHITLRAPQEDNVMQKVANYSSGSTTSLRKPDTGYFRKGDGGYTLHTSGTYDASVGFVFDYYVATWKDFPDSKFGQYIYDRLGYYVYSEAADNVSNINVCNKGITDLTGLEYFQNLQVLHCDTNKLASLDVSKNKELTTLSCCFNNIQRLYVHNNDDLAYLDCSDNQLNYLGISTTGNAKLKHLNCCNNYLGSLQLNPASLTELFCYNNHIGALGTKSMTKLTRLYCAGNKLYTLDVSQCPDLWYLDCSNNILKTLTVNSSGLKTLFCYDNKLSSLDLSGCKLLITLRCQNNELTSLNVDGTNNLQYLRAYGNQLNGSGMTDFINSLYTRSQKCYIELVNHTDPDEQNEFTAADAQTAKSRNWTPWHRTSPDEDKYVASDECATYDLWVGGQKLGSCIASPTGVRYDNGTKTLTLTNANITGQNITGDAPYGCGIFSAIRDLTINCKGNNAVSGFNRDKDYNFGIGLRSSTTINGSESGGEKGKLTATGNSGIFSISGSLTISGDLDLEASGKNYGLAGTGDLKIDGNVAVSATSSESYSPIRNWGALTLGSGLAFTEPVGASYSYKSVIDRDGKVITGGTVKIGLPDPHKAGDVNEDGEISTADVVAIYNYIIDGEASGIDKSRADVDGDGEVGTADVVAVYNIIIVGE